MSDGVEELKVIDQDGGMESVSKVDNVNQTNRLQTKINFFKLENETEINLLAE